MKGVAATGVAAVVITGAMTLFTSATVRAQFEKGDIELSFSSSFQKVKREHVEEVAWNLDLSCRIGYFVTDKLEIEPEFLFALYKDEDAGIVFSANIDYNFDPLGEEKKAVPFVLAGVGAANTFPLVSDLAAPGMDETVRLINLGAGFKVFMPKPISMRIEYRFQKYPSEVDYTYHQLLMGISVFLE